MFAIALVLTLIKSELTTGKKGSKFAIIMTGYQLKPKKFHVYIIESPSSIDLYKKNFEGDSLRETLRLSNISSSHILAVDMESFKTAFYVGLVEYFKTAKSNPIIHISAHGNENGIQLTSKEMVSWDLLREFLLPINKTLNGGLILCLSSCQSYTGSIMSMKDDDFPFIGVVANTGSPLWSETNIAYASFYHLFAKGLSIHDAVYGMKKASGNNSFKYIKSQVARQAYLRVVQTQQAITTMQENIPSNNPNTLLKALQPK